MNWPMLFDVLAWFWGIVFTMAWAVVFGGSAIETAKWGGVRNLPGTRRGFWVYSFLASICWAWIIAS